MGQVLDVAMIDGVASLLGGVLQLKASGEWSPGREANWLQGAAPWYRAYETSDGAFVTVGPLEAGFYALLLARLGLALEQWPQWDRTRWPALGAELERIFAAHTREHWCDVLEGTDACFAPALTLDDAPRHPHVAARGMYVERQGFLQPAPVPRFARTPGQIDRPPPWAGEHTREILREVGIGEEGVDELIEQQVARQAA